MKVDLAHYRRVNKPAIASIVRHRKDSKPYEMIGELAVATNVPIIAVAHYVGELFGFTKELDERIASWMQFYQVTEVLNQER